MKDFEMKNSDIKYSDANNSELKDSEIKNSETKDSEIKNSETKYSEIKDFETMGSEIKESETKESDIKDFEIKDSEIKDFETKRPETKGPETKGPETKDSETKDSEIKDSETPEIGLDDKGYLNVSKPGGELNSTHKIETAGTNATGSQNTDNLANIDDKENLMPEVIHRGKNCIENENFQADGSSWLCCDGCNRNLDKECLAIYSQGIYVSYSSKMLNTKQKSFYLLF